nr:MAG TPA: hypothetical protein [Caudoviricetes sp.]
MAFLGAHGIIERETLARNQRREGEIIPWIP